jgi:RecB family endonuclease NucS
VDIFIKLKHPVGSNKYVLIEVKTGSAQKSDFYQLTNYLDEFKEEAAGGILIAKKFPKKMNLNHEALRILPVRYYFESLDVDREYLFDELLNILKMEVVG